MKKTVQKLTYTLGVIILLILSSCWHNSGESDHITGNYYVEWHDLVSNRSIVEKSSRDSSSSYPVSSSYVFAVGHNEDFIIAKTHPHLNDLTITKYVNIDLKKRKENSKKGVYKYLDKEEFDEKSKAFGISELQFDQLYPENPFQKN